MTPCRLLALASVLCVASVAGARPAMTEDADHYTVTGNGYRVVFSRETGGLSYELPDGANAWKPVARMPQDLVSALSVEGDILQAGPQRATWATTTGADFIAVSRRMRLGISGRTAQLEHLCTDEGVLIGYQVAGDVGQGSFWSPPRLGLRVDDWDGYACYGPDGRRHAGELAALQPYPAYAGVSPWGNQGDTVPRFDAKHPALIVRSQARGLALGVVYLNYETDWQGGSGFVQRHTASALYFYCGMSPAGGDRIRWAWLAPFGGLDAAAETARVEALLRQGETLVASYTPPVAKLPEDWLKPIPDFPAALRRPAPVTGIRDAVVYTINEDTNSPEGVALARKVGSDVLVRAWFKWGNRPPVEKWQEFPPQIHQLGALFGGGITCSALYDNENGITPEQLADMATRGTDGKYVDAWDQPGCRHGSLSSPAYLDYLFRWCKEQIDAGADYLFMDENTAALGQKEGYDDHSLADFRLYLTRHCPQTEGYKPDDPRWRDMWGVPLDNREVCPDGTMATFSYRAFLRVQGLVEKPLQEKNKLGTLWWQFRTFRDDRAWKALTDRMRAYAKAQGRRLLISGNGLVKYVDLQVLGVWGDWAVKGGHVDLSEGQISRWRGQIERGREIAGGTVPVVFFHDWGFGDPPFPWLAVPPADRELWMRTRGAEIYAAGGFFAFPVLGPFNCNAGEDGTLRCIAGQTAFYQAHRDIYVSPGYLGSATLKSDTDRLSLAAWWQPEPKSLLVHVINRATDGARLVPRKHITVRLPVSTAPTQATVVSPDAEGAAPVTCHLAGDQLEVTLPALQAYSVAILKYAVAPNLDRLVDPVYTRPTPHWGRPAQNEFRVGPRGVVANSSGLISYLQGMLHTELRNPPTFLVNADGPGRLEVHIRAVAAAGAKLELRVDGEPKQTVDLPDLDGRNDGNAPEYNRTFTLDVPAGQHRLTLDNIGGDWAVVDWLAFRGKFLEAR